MQKKQKHNNKRGTLQHRKNFEGVAHRQRRLSKKRLSAGSRGKQPLPYSNGFASNHLLSLPVRTFNYFNSVRDWKIEAFIKGIYPCLKNIPGFNSAKEWSKLPSKDDLAQFLLDEAIRNCPKGFDWMISDEEGEFKIYYYQICPVDVNFSCVPLEWLYKVEEKDKLLFEMICALIYKVHSRFNTPIITDRFTDIIMDDMGTWDHEEMEEHDRIIMLNHIAQYKQNGKAYKLYHYMKRQAHNYSDKVLIDSILRLKSKRGLKGDIIGWLKLGVSCLNEYVDLDTLTLPLDGYEDGALDVKSNYCFHYSFHDRVAIEGETWRNDTYQNVGEIDPAIYYTYTAYGETKPANPQAIKNLTTFMTCGRTIYWRYFEQEFEKHYEAEQREYAEIHA